MTFAVIVEGTILRGFDAPSACTKLSQLTRQSEQVAARLLAGHASTVKRGVDEATAMRYVTALRNIGVASRTEVETLDIDVEPSMAPAPRAATSPRTMEEFAPQSGRQTHPTRASVGVHPPGLPAVKKKSSRWRVLGAILVGLWIMGLIMKPSRQDSRPIAAAVVQTNPAPAAKTQDSELEELCQNFVFFKAKSYKHGREGNESARADAFRDMQQAAVYLKKFPEAEVGRVCSKFDTEANLAKYMR